METIGDPGSALVPKGNRQHRDKTTFPGTRLSCYPGRPTAPTVPDPPATSNVAQCLIQGHSAQLNGWIIRWQRWHGRLPFEADKLLSLYGPVVRIAPNLVLVNDVQSVQSLFAQQDLDTAPTAIRALRIGGHDWTVTYPQNPVARSRRRPVMVATTNKAMRYWHSEDIVYHLRVTALLNSQAVMASPQANLEPGDLPHVVGEYNFLVVWRLCLPEWLFYWLKWSPFRHAKFRVQSSDRLFRLVKEIVDEAANWAEDDAISTVHELLAKSMKAGRFEDDPTEISAEMAGQILAAITTSSALAFIFYCLAREPNLVDALYDELQSAEGLKDLEGLQLLNACITEGLRFRPPVALTGSRVVPPGGLSIMGYFVPAGTVVTTQSLSLSRQGRDLFPNYDEYDPARWLEDDKLISERRRCLAPFGMAPGAAPAATWPPSRCA
ncbi:cytochrome P450 [Microdochium bolleyi]|uniref:Cytochrome P450 n=1 Tax=Microdochium bolleyi TaxID=196109 RepID=A0A136IK31_9PEZI|nr:cytochrome P450 [Microdochium bolleyi]